METRNSEKAKKDESKGSKGKNICTRFSTRSGSSTQETSGLRSSSREKALSKKPVILSPGTRKSERLEKQTLTPSPVTRKSERVQKKSMSTRVGGSDRRKKLVSPISVGSRKSSAERGNNLSSSSSLRSRKFNPDSSDVEQKIDKKEKTIKQLAEEAREVNKKSRAPVYRSWLKSQAKKSDVLANTREEKIMDAKQVARGECSDGGGKHLEKSGEEVEHENLVEQSPSLSSRSNANDRHKDEGHVSADAECIANTASVASGEDSHILHVPADSQSESSKLVVSGTNLRSLSLKNLEKASADVDPESLEEQSLSRSSRSYQNDVHRDEGTVSADNTVQVPADSQSESAKFLASRTNLEREVVDPPMSRKRKASELESDANGATINDVMTDDLHILSLPPKRGDTCLKKKKVDHDSTMHRDCYQDAKPDQELNSKPSSKDRGEIEAGLTTGLKEIHNKLMHQNASDGCNTDSSRYEEYWVPVQISEIQLEQYCATLMSNLLYLCSSLKTDPVGALCNTLISVRKTCDHPYIVDQSLPLTLTKDMKEINYLGVGIKASGKLELLEAMLTVARNKGLKIVVLFQTTGGAGRDSTADILDDFVRQKFGPVSYEAIGRDNVASKKQTAMNKFNKEKERFVLLLELSACTPSIKFSMVGAFIIFDSNWSPLNDLRALQKMKIEPGLDKIKIFRLYSFCTVEEKVLILARERKYADCSRAQDLSPATTHQLLMWGAPYLFNKLEVFHNNQNSTTDISYEQSLLERVVAEFSTILSQSHGDRGKIKLSLILEARYSQGTYSTDSALLGEEKVKLFNEDRTDIFWTKLLVGKNPNWKYSSASSRRTRKRVQYNSDSENAPLVDNDGVSKKRKKLVGRGVDLDEPVIRWKGSEGAVGSSALDGSETSPRSASFGNDTVTGNYVSGLRSLVDDEQKRLGESQKSLHAVLKPVIAKLCEVLHLSDGARSMADMFLEYVMSNHKVSAEPETTLQAFQIAVCWVAASLLKLKIGRKESLALVKQQLGFGCTLEEVGYWHSMLCCLKSMFLASVRSLKLESHPKASEGFIDTDDKNQSILKLSRATVHQKAESMNTEDRLPPVECTTEQNAVNAGFACELQLARKDLSKSLKDIRKKCRKHLTNLIEKHKEEKAGIERQYEEEKRQLENEKKMEAALIRLSSNILIRADKLKKIDVEYAKKFEEHKCKLDKRLQDLEMMHEAARNNLNQKEALWIGKVRSWAETELFNPSFSNCVLSLPCSVTTTSKISDNDVVMAYNNSVRTDENREYNVVEDTTLETQNTTGPAFDGDGHLDISEIVASDRVHKIIIPAISSSPQPVHEVSAESMRNNEQIPSTEPQRASDTVQEDILLAVSSSPQRVHEGFAESILNNEQIPSSEPELVNIVASSTCQEDILPVASSSQEHGHEQSADGRHNGQAPLSNEPVLTTFGEGVENTVSSISSLAGDEVADGVTPPEPDEDISLGVPDVTEPSIGLQTTTSVTPNFNEDQVTASATSLIPEAVPTTAACCALTDGVTPPEPDEDISLKVPGITEPCVVLETAASITPTVNGDQVTASAASSIPEAVPTITACSALIDGVTPPEPDEDISLRVPGITESSLGYITSIIPTVNEDQVTASATSSIPEAVPAIAICSPRTGGENVSTGNDTSSTFLTVNQQHPEFVTLNEEIVREVMYEIELPLVQPLSASENDPSLNYITSITPTVNGDQVTALATSSVPEAVPAICCPLTGGENVSNGNGTSSISLTANQPNPESLTLNEETLREVMDQTDLPLVQPLTASELDSSRLSDPAVHETCPPLSSPATNQVEPTAAIEIQNNSEVGQQPLAERSARSDCEAVIEETGTQVQPSSSRNASSAAIEDEFVCLRNIQASMQHIQSQTELDRHALMMQTPPISQGSQPAIPGLPFPLQNDPFKNELERLRRETGNLVNMHEEAMSKMKAELEREIAELHRKYKSKRQEAETEFIAKKKELETNKSYVLMHKMLADAFRSKCYDARARPTPGKGARAIPGARSVPGARSDAGSGYVCQRVQPPSQNGTQRPQLFAVRHPPTSSVPPNLPNRAQPVAIPSSTASSVPPNLPNLRNRPQVVAAPSQSVSPVRLNVPNAVLVPRSMAPATSPRLYSLRDTRPSPQFASPSTFTGTTPLGGRLRPPPHLQHRSRPPSAPPTSANSNQAFRPHQIPNQHRPMVPSTTHQPGVYNRVETAGATSGLNPRFVAVDLLGDVSNQTGVNPNGNLSSPMTSLDIAAQAQHASQNRSQADPVAAGGRTDVVCVSDDDD